MPFVRNPFRKQDENARPVVLDGVAKQVNGDATKAADITEVENAEYKLSDINDSGICLPPSPVERKSFWGHTNSSRSTTSSNHRSLVNETDQFNISRESFDSYRRSFDISGRSPVIRPNEYNSRGSLDSRSFLPPPSTRISNSFARPPPVPIVPPAMKEEDFEDVGLEDTKPQQTKKKGLFARLTESSTDHNAAPADARPSSAHEKSSWHHFGGRKRGQSGQGAELGSLPGVTSNPAATKRDETPKPVDRAVKSSATPLPSEPIQAPIT